MKTVLESRGISKYYQSGNISVTAVNSVSFTIQQSEIVLIMGPSGSGKTSLLSMLGGLLTPDEGEVIINDVNISALNNTDSADFRANTIGFIFQSFNLLDALTVEENILFPSTLVKQDMKLVKRRCNDLIKELSLTHRANAYPHTLSGGEQQRVAIARAMINQPGLILADEPTGNLDSQAGLEVMMLLHDIARGQGVSVLIVTHDPRVEDVADRILWLEDGKLIERQTEEHEWVRDPVCGMRVDQWHSTQFVDYENIRYTFCTKRCRDKFLLSPHEYLS